MLVCHHRQTSLPFHHLAGDEALHHQVFQDLRADKIVREWNSGLVMRGLRAGGRLLHTITRQPRYLAAAIYKLKNGMVVPRLVWALQNIPGLKEAANKGEVLFGCIDSFLIYK